MSENNNFQKTTEALFKGMDSFLSTKTVVGEPIHIEDNILIPLADVSFGVGAGAFQESAKNSGGGGMGAKIVPSSILVIDHNGIRMISVKNDDRIMKLIDMVPDLLDRFIRKGKKDELDEILDEAKAKEEAKEEAKADEKAEEKA